MQSLFYLIKFNKNFLLYKPNHDESCIQASKGESMRRTLVWFRQDLRLADNPALSHAVASGRVLAVYVLDTTNHSDTDNALSHVAETGLGSASAWWLHSSLVQLKQATEGHLLVVSGDPRNEIPKIAKQYDCDSVAWNRCYHPWQTERDTEIKASLIQQSIEVNTFNGSLLWEQWTVLKKDGTPYKVFTPFYRKGCLASQEPRFPLPAPENIEWIETDSEYTVSDKIASDLIVGRRVGSS